MEFSLREWGLQYVDSLAESANDRRVSQYLNDLFPYPYTVEDAQRFLSFVRNHPQDICRAIVVEERAVGCVGLTRGKFVKKLSAEIGYWLAPAYWNAGIMTKAVRQICGEAFERTDLVRIWAEVFAPNAASVRVLEKCGFIREGMLRNSVCKGGALYDSIVLGLCKDRFSADRAK